MCSFKKQLVSVRICTEHCHLFVSQEREMECKSRALDEERRRREELEKRLQEETSRRQKLIEREVKLREKQRAQVSHVRRCASLLNKHLTLIIFVL